MAEEAGEAEVSLNSFFFFILARNIDNFELNHVMYFIFTRRKKEYHRRSHPKNDYFVTNLKVSQFADAV